MDDLISRQAAIDELDKGAWGVEWDKTLAKTMIESLPSVQPEPIKINIEDINKEDWERFKKEWGNTPITVLPSAQPQTSMLTVECKLDDEELAKAIEEVKKANLELIAAEPHWIPCSEQLPPEENKTYWVCTDNGHQHECRWTNANPIWTHLTTDWHWNIFDIPQYTKVVAWMELPKPYDGGEQDG